MKNIFKLAAVALAAILALPSCGPKETPVKVISFNIRVCPNERQDGENNWMYRRDAVINFFRTANPDLIGMQEVTTPQLTFLEESLEGEYTFYGVDRISGEKVGPQESMTVAFRNDRFDLVDKGSFWLSETPDEVSKGWDGACHRVASWVHLKDKINGGKSVYFVNTHFDHIGPVARLQSSHLIVSRIKEIMGEDFDHAAAGDGKASLFLTADFNSELKDEALAPLLETFTCADIKAESISITSNSYQGYGKADYGGRNDVVIDHIFCLGAQPKSFKVDTADYGAKYISDHYPVVMEGIIL